MAKLTHDALTPELAIQHCKSIAEECGVNLSFVAQRMTRAMITCMMEWPHGPELLEKLFPYVSKRIDKHGCDGTFRWTKKFLKNHRLTKAEIAVCILFFTGRSAKCDRDIVSSARPQIWPDRLQDEESGQ